eukprot:SAG31_NODE_5153_length_2712_cov_2.029851_1_plen_155_part_00
MALQGGSKSRDSPVGRRTAHKTRPHALPGFCSRPRAGSHCCYLCLADCAAACQRRADRRAAAVAAAASLFSRAATEPRAAVRWALQCLARAVPIERAGRLAHRSMPFGVTQCPSSQSLRLRPPALPSALAAQSAKFSACPSRRCGRSIREYGRF